MDTFPTEPTDSDRPGLPGRSLRIRHLLLPDNQRRSLENLSADLDLRSGDRVAKKSAFWIMLTLSAVVASAGVLADSTATVIGAMIIAPLSTPIMGIALGIAKRERNRSTWFVLAGCVLVITIGACFSRLLPGGYDLLANAQVQGRVSPGALDMVAALATGLAGAIALARRDVAAVLPGVAIAISLVPPLAVVGICLGRGDAGLASGAAFLFLSNLLALVFAGALVFATLGYAEEAIADRGGSRRRAYTFLATMSFLVAVPLVANTFVTYVLSTYTARIERAAETWVSTVPGARVTGVENHGLTVTVTVQSPSPLPPPRDLLDLVADVPDVIGITVEEVRGTVTEVRVAGGD